MRISITSVMVEDQEKALKFYTEVLGFIKKSDIPMGEYKWLTLVSPDGPADVELLLEPMAFEPARTYQQALFNAGIPWTSFAVNNIQQEYERLLQHGVEFKAPPTATGTVTAAVFDDTCGNLIHLFESNP